MAYMKDKAGRRLDSFKVADESNRFKTSQLVKNRLTETIMATPPTFSASATATITGPTVNIPETDPRFRVNGARTITKNGAQVPAASTKLDATIAVFQGSWRHSFDFDGQSFEFRTIPGTDTQLLIWANEQPHAAAPIQMTTIAGAVSGTATWVKVNFGSRARRRVVVELLGQTQVNFNSINKLPTDTILAPSIPSSRLVWVGDSQGYGIGADSTGYNDPRQAFTTWAAWTLGIDDIFISTCQPSAGMVQPIAGNIGNHRSRLVSDMLPLNPDILVIQGSVNDGNGWPALQGQIQTTTLDYINTAKAALPNCRIIVTGPIYAGEATSTHRSIGAECKAAADSAGVTYIDTVSPTEPVFTGTGAPTNLIGDGNADYYREYGAVYTHPNKAGHRHLAAWMAGKLASALKIPL